MSGHTTSTQSGSYQMEMSRWSAGRNVLMLASLISIVACVAGYLADPERFFRSYLVAFTFTSAVGLGAFFFVMVQYLTGSAWSVTIRRIMENIMITLPVGAILFLPLAFGLKYVYSWTDLHMMQSSEALKGKTGYLSENFFIIRTYIYFFLWSIWIFSIYRNSTKQDATHSIKQMHANSAWSAPGLFLSVVVGSLAAFDWLMSLQPSLVFDHLRPLLSGWRSAELHGGGHADLPGLPQSGVLKEAISPEHYHDLGKWLFALTAFYTYMAFSQYMLIWYANLPEETIFYRTRMPGGWFWISILMPFLRFLIPFFVLLCRPAKRSLTVIGLVAAYSLVIEYVDLYWLVMPVYYPTSSASLAGFCHAGRDSERQRLDVLEQVQEEQDDSRRRPAPGAEPAF